MTDKPTPTDAELKAMWQLHAADIGGILDFARAVLAKWGQPAQAEEPVARYEYNGDLDAWFLTYSNNPKAKTRQLVFGDTAPQPVAREPLTDGQIQDLLLCGNPTDEEMRLIRIGWDAANGIKGENHDR